MSNPFLNLVNMARERTHVLPDGWVRKDEMAAILSCPVEKVSAELQIPMRLGWVRTKSFRIYDREVKSIVGVTAYEITNAGKNALGNPIDPKNRVYDKWSDEEVATVTRMRAVKKPWSAIAKQLNRSKASVRSKFRHLD